MASREKTRQFLAESEVVQHYAGIVEYTLTFFVHKAQKEGNARLAADLLKAKDEYHLDFQTGVEVSEEVYSETFSDEELDDLIILHCNPALKKARALTATIMNKILERYLEASA